MSKKNFLAKKLRTVKKTQMYQLANNSPHNKSPYHSLVFQLLAAASTRYSIYSLCSINIHHIVTFCFHPNLAQIKSRQSFLCLVNCFRCFIPAAARLLLPLTAALTSGPAGSFKVNFVT
jgi:hypothetical protein